LRELSRVVRDMMVLSIDPARAGDGDLAEGERERLGELGRRFSREDLMRAFDVLSKAEQEIRTVSHPRYYFEMVLLRWMHLRKLVPLADLLEQLGSGGGTARSASAPPSRAAAPPARTPPVASKPQVSSKPPAPVVAKVPDAPPAPAPGAAATAHAAGATAPFKDALLAEIRAGKPFFYNTVVAQAQKIEVSGDRVTFTFLPTHRMLREQFEQSRGWLESAAERVAGRRIMVEAVQSAAAPDAGSAPAAPPAADGGAKRDLKAEAMTSSAVQAILDVFPAEISDVEDMK